MIILDTNVVSEAMKPQPDATVKAWLNRQAADTMFITSVTLAELLFGLGAMPQGKRKQTLESALYALLALFEQRILPFDANAASTYARLAVQLRADGRGFPLPDGYIAAIAAARGFAVSTRDTSPFMVANLKVINPWEP